MSNIFQNVAGLRPGRSVFDLSYEKKLTCDMGQLIPVMCDEVVPGDIFEIANQIVIRFQPLVAPIMHEVNAYVHYFFVPYRLLWEDWENFITGGVDGDDESVLPRWSITNAETETTIGTLWDYMGFPTDVNPVGAYPLDFPRRAYNYIYNEYYRDETLTTEVGLNNYIVLNRAWEKDYFTSALPWQQRGTAPALPISGTTNAVFAGSINAPIYPDGSISETTKLRVAKASGASIYSVESTGSSLVLLNPAIAVNPKSALDDNVVDFSDAATFDVADLRLAFQIQKWMERNARAGARYTESLRAHFGVAPRDERLQRPEYIGGSKSPIIVSEVLQTSSTDTTSAQGNQAGHGITADGTYIGKYRAEEYGLIMGIMSVMPRTAYSQGIDRQWLRRSRYDFYFPEFANLSEQAIENAELYARGTSEADNRGIFGYQGRYDEMRVKKNQICGLMRSDFDYWHMGRKFTSMPTLSSAFVVSNPTKRIFAAPSEPGLVVNFANKIKAIRPLPIQSDPGLIDHN